MRTLDELQGGGVRAQVTAPVPEQWRTALERLADRNGRSMADELRAALEEHFENQGESYAAPVVLDGQLEIGASA